MRELDDITLARAQQGDAAAFRQLVVTYQRPVHAVIGRMLTGASSAAEVEELAQETFFRVYRALGDFAPRGPGRLSKWVLTIASRLALDELRKRKLPTTPIDDAGPLSGGASADSRLERLRLGGAIERAALALTVEQRAVFVLREYHGFDYQELARALDIEVGTVKSRLSRARAILREQLAEVRYG